MQLGLCIETALTELPFEQRLDKAAEIGLTHVEMWLVDRSFRGTPEDLAGRADRAGVQITNTVIGSPDGGGLTDPACRDAWLERVRATLDFNVAAGIPAAIVCTGNEIEGMTDEQMMASVLEGLKPTVEIAEQARVTLLLEPLNTTVDHPGYWLTGSDRGAEICRLLASERMKLLFDCYHMQIMEGDLVRHIERNLDVIGHFHSAGVPGRHEVYDGEVNYPFLVEQIARLGYHGVFGLEYLPTVDGETSVRRSLAHLSGAMA